MSSRKKAAVDGDRSGGCDSITIASGFEFSVHTMAEITVSPGSPPAVGWGSCRHRWWPSPILSASAFCRNDPSDRFISLAIFLTGVLAFECCLNSLMSAAVYGFRARFFFFVLTNLLLRESTNAMALW